MAKLELVGVKKSFSTQKQQLAVVNNIHLQVTAHQFVTILGPSGCGKSTIFNMIAGLLKPDDGEILFDGKPLAEPSKLVSYMPQKDLLLPWKKVLDNVILPLKIAGINPQLAITKALALMDIFGLKGFENHFPAQLSGGMRQRAALMRTVLANKEVLLLDEPFGALDAITRFRMQSWLLDIWQHFQSTIIFITHDVEEAIFLSDLIYVMSERPGTIKLAIDIPLPRPRSPKLVTAKEFVHLKDYILSSLT